MKMILSPQSATSNASRCERHNFSPIILQHSGSSLLPDKIRHFILDKGKACIISMTPLLLISQDVRSRVFRLVISLIMVAYFRSKKIKDYKSETINLVPLLYKHKKLILRPILFLNILCQLLEDI